MKILNFISDFSSIIYENSTKLSDFPLLAVTYGISIKQNLCIDRITPQKILLEEILDDFSQNDPNINYFKIIIPIILPLYTYKTQNKHAVTCDHSLNSSLSAELINVSIN